MADETAVSGVVQFSFIVTATVSVVGWFVVGYFADKREFRKEVREHVKELKSRADAVRVSAREYWINVSAKDAPVAACILKAEMQSLARQSAVVASLGLAYDPFLVVAIRKEATGGDFEKRGRRHSRADVDTLANVNGAVEDLLAAVDIAFYDRFPPSRTRRWWTKIPLILVPFLVSDHR